MSHVSLVVCVRQQKDPINESSIREILRVKRSLPRHMKFLVAFPSGSRCTTGECLTYGRFDVGLGALGRAIRA